MKCLKAITFFLFISFLLFTGMQCKKDKIGIEALPPATQEGKNTFGCLVNGEVFLPKGNFSSGNPINSIYQFSSSESKYYLAIGASNNSNNLIDVTIAYNGLEINLGKFDLVEQIENHFGGYYTIFNGGSIDEYVTNNIVKGELTITRFDKTNQIISGIFWYDAVNNKGDKVEVREGRFDVKYVK